VVAGSNPWSIGLDSLSARYPTLPENEITAAFLAVEDTLGKVDLSDTALFADDADPEKLARRVRAKYPSHAREAMRAERAAELYERILDQGLPPARTSRAPRAVVPTERNSAVIGAKASSPISFGTRSLASASRRPTRTT
jgi:hypothetical protein